MVVDVAKGLVDAQTVGAVGANGLGNLVEIGDAVGGDNLAANLQIGSYETYMLA